MEQNTFLCPASICGIVHFWSLQQHENVYIWVSNIYRKNPESLVPANTWGILLLWLLQLVEVLCISCRSNYVRHCITLVPANIWDSVHLWFRQLLEAQKVFVPCKYSRHYLCVSSNYLRHCSSLVPVSTWDNVHLLSKQLHKTPYNSGTVNYLSHSPSLFSATTCFLVKFCPYNYERTCTSEFPLTTWNNLNLWS